MREVIAGIIWIGNAGDGQNIDRVIQLDIKSIVHLAFEEPAFPFPRDRIYCRFPLLDGSDNESVTLNLAIQSVASLIEANVPTLVTCSGGMSRSPAIVAAALSLSKQTPVDDCLNQITASGPHDISPALWNEVRDLVTFD